MYEFVVLKRSSSKSNQERKYEKLITDLRVKKGHLVSENVKESIIR